ncbi:hypothetical protein ACIG56_02620 [Nocardia fusca]|uniref:hypothetical protein n=1 Tax=Nocardia fusca TaxID=941183 RepID=UPI0037CC548E
MPPEVALSSAARTSPISGELGDYASTVHGMHSATSAGQHGSPPLNLGDGVDGDDQVPACRGVFLVELGESRIAIGHPESTRVELGGSQRISAQMP